MPAVQVLSFGHQSIGAGDGKPAQLTHHVRRQPHAIGNTPVSARIVDASARLAVEQLAANVREVNLARVLVFELDEAAAAAAVAQAFPFGETHLIEGFRAPEWQCLLVLRRQTFRPVGACEALGRRSEPSFNTRLAPNHTPVSDVMANGLSLARAREVRRSQKGERKSPRRTAKTRPRSSSRIPPASRTTWARAIPSGPTACVRSTARLRARRFRCWRAIPPRSLTTHRSPASIRRITSKPSAR